MCVIILYYRYLIANKKDCHCFILFIQVDVYLNNASIMSNNSNNLTLAISFSNNH